MTNWRKSFPSKFFKSADLDAPLILTIKRLVNEKVGDPPELKPVLYFEEDVRGVVLNQTRGEAVEKIAGSEDMDDWPGTRILLRRGSTQLRGKTVDCIEIAAPPKRTKPGPGGGGPPAVPGRGGVATEEPYDDESF